MKYFYSVRLNKLNVQSMKIIFTVQKYFFLAVNIHKMIISMPLNVLIFYRLSRIYECILYNLIQIISKFENNNGFKQC